MFDPNHVAPGAHLCACLAIALIGSACAGRGAILVTTSVEASSVASIVYAGVPSNASQVTTGLTQAATQALVGSADTPEARTAARVSDAGIAANARYDNKIFKLGNLIDDDSQAFYTGLIENVTGSP